MTEQNPLLAMLDNPSHYERMVCHGMWVLEARRHVVELMDGQRWQCIVPNFDDLALQDVPNEAAARIVDYKATRIGPFGYVVYGSLRPWEDSAWVEVGKIK